MPGGRYDSSLTRVGPVFDRLAKRTDDWIRKLLELPISGFAQVVIPETLDLSFQNGCWGSDEISLRPPVSLLSWLVRHPENWAVKPDNEERVQLYSHDIDTVGRALELLRTSGLDRGWFIFEGRTHPDAMLVTPDAIVVVEGKRTELGPTTHTKWMAGRHQIWRHIDAAWEIRGRRNVYGILLVEGEDDHQVPEKWLRAVENTLSEEGIEGSFPHRPSDEIADIRQCFLGVCTWQQVCGSFGIDFNELPETTADIDM